MSRSEITSAASVPLLNGRGAAAPGAAARHNGWLARHLPMPIIAVGLAATVGWMGMIAWWIFAFVRWAIG